MALSMLAPEAVLATTLATEFAPATNLRGVVAGATWRYALPSMERGRVVCLGRPSPADLDTLAAQATEVVVIEAGGDRAVRTSGRDGDAVRSIAGSAVSAWLADRAAGSVDLVWLTPSLRAAPVPASVHDALIDALPRLLARDGVLLDAAGVLPDASDRPAPADRRVQRLELRPADGAVRSAVAAEDEDAVTMLARRGMLGADRGLPGPRPVRAVLRPLLGPLLRRRPGAARTVLLETATAHGIGETLPGPPAYLASLAAEGGLDLRGYHCAIAAPGVYNTQKVLALLWAPGATEPAIIVKMTRDPSVNARLDNERDALRMLGSLGLATDDRVPIVQFAGRHAGLAIVGEGAIPGVPFADRVGADPSGGPILDALEWLTVLAAGSVRHAAPADLAHALSDLHGRWVALCRPSSAEAGRLAGAIEAVAAADRPIPLVFQHGDPGTWNLLVGDDGLVRFLDWENAEPAGPPLWDLLYLLRSHAVGAARRAGVRRRLVAVERWFFGASPVSGLVADSIDRYLARIGLDPGLVEPLFHLCWMHQALKEATRMAPDQVRGGHYNRLLRMGLEQRSAPTLRRIFEGAR